MDAEDVDELPAIDAGVAGAESSESGASVPDVTLELAPTSVIPWSGRSAHADDPAAAIARLPGTAGQDPFDRLAVAFLLGYPAHSARAYATDLRVWATWCTNLGVHPFTPAATTSTPGSAT